jgi:hypothetical protein
MRWNSTKIRVSEDFFRQACIIACIGLGVAMMGLDLIAMAAAR